MDYYVLKKSKKLSFCQHWEVMSNICILNNLACLPTVQCASEAAEAHHGGDRGWAVQGEDAATQDPARGGGHAGGSGGTEQGNLLPQDQTEVRVLN